MHHSEQLLNYIKNQILSGVPEEDIYSALVGVGWKEEDIVEAFKFADNKNNTLIQQYYPRKKNKIALITSLFLLLFILIASFLTYQKILSNKKLAQELYFENKISSSTQSNLTQGEYVEKMYNKNTQTKTYISILANNISSCKKSSNSFPSSYNNKVFYILEIVGIAENKCNIVEYFPKGFGNVSCKFDLKKLPNLADSFDKYLQNISTSSNITNQEISNPMQYDKSCTINTN